MNETKSLKINDVRVSITLACRANNWELEEWRDESEFRRNPDHVTISDSRGKRFNKPVLPDGYFRLGNLPRGATGRAHFMLEVDRATEPHHKVKPQILVYQAYTTSGQFQERYNAKSLRILIVTTTHRRLENLKAVVKSVGGDRKYWFTTFDKITPDTVLIAPIWQQIESKELVPLVAPGL
jgi:hypothetical protein